MASVATWTAVWKPTVTSVPPMSLSIVFGTPTIFTPSRPGVRRRRACPRRRSRRGRPPHDARVSPRRAPARPRTGRGSRRRTRGSCRLGAGCRSVSAMPSGCVASSRRPRHPSWNPTKSMPCARTPAADDRPDHRVQSGTVTTAGEDTEAHDGAPYPTVGAHPARIGCRRCWRSGVPRVVLPRPADAAGGASSASSRLFVAIQLFRNPGRAPRHGARRRPRGRRSPSGGRRPCRRTVQTRSGRKADPRRGSRSERWARTRGTSLRDLGRDPSRRFLRTRVHTSGRTSRDRGRHGVRRDARSGRPRSRPDPSIPRQDPRSCRRGVLAPPRQAEVDRDRRACPRAGRSPRPAGGPGIPRRTERVGATDPSEAAAPAPRSGSSDAGRLKGRRRRPSRAPRRAPAGAGAARSPAAAGCRPLHPDDPGHGLRARAESVDVPGGDPDHRRAHDGTIVVPASPRRIAGASSRSPIITRFPPASRKSIAAWIFGPIEPAPNSPVFSSAGRLVDGHPRRCPRDRGCRTRAAPSSRR